MWLITPLGFFSIVCKPGDEEQGTLTVRSRVKSDLEALGKNFLPSLGAIVEGAGTDYRYRAKAQRDDIGKALTLMVQQLDYENFKNEVAHRQGKYRASVYGKVWEVLYNLQEAPANVLVKAYGGVVLDKGRVLLRRPKGDFDGYVWTFPKGRPDAGEAPEQAALREVKEETGYSAKVIRKLPGSFRGGTSVSEYFLMSPVGSPSPFDSKETSAIRWATIDKAAKLIGMTTNEIGQGRDLSVLKAARRALKP
jgi:8-oxo-dGTP pyrophosphatase MutT (NUDIX family)